MLREFCRTTIASDKSSLQRKQVSTTMTQFLAIKKTLYQNQKNKIAFVVLYSYSFGQIFAPSSFGFYLTHPLRVFCESLCNISV